MRINGSIDFIELEDLKQLLNKIFAGNRVEYKTRIFGDEFRIFDESYELYVSTFDPINNFPMKKPRFIIEGNIIMELSEALREVHRITNQIRQADIGYCITIYPIEGDEMVDIELRSVQYYNLYERKKIKDGI